MVFILKREFKTNSNLIMPVTLLIYQIKNPKYTTEGSGDQRKLFDVANIRLIGHSSYRKSTMATKFDFFGVNYSYNVRVIGSQP